MEPSWYKALENEKASKLELFRKNDVVNKPPVKDDKETLERARRLITASLSHKKPSTLRSYSYALKSFADFLGIEDQAKAVANILRMDRGDANFTVLDYLSWLEKTGCSASTIRTRLAAIKGRISDAKLIGWIDWDIEVQGPPKKSTKNVEGPSPEEFAKVIDYIQKLEGPIGIRNRAIFYLLSFMGLRRNEILSLDVEHLDMVKKRIKILRKGKDHREWKTVPGKTWQAIEAWMAIREFGEGPVFTNFDSSNKGQSKRLTGDSLYRILRGIGQKSQVPWLHPHALRHASTTNVLELTDGNIRIAQKFTGHSDPRMLDVYEDERQDVAGKAAQMIEDHWLLKSSPANEPPDIIA